MLADAPFGRLLTAMVTPFAPDGRVDLRAAARVARHLADNGSDGIVVSGTTGESPTTSADECGDLLSAVKEAVGDTVAVVAGVGTASTAHSVELAEQAARIGADGLLLVTPYYSKPSPAGVLAHFRAVATATDVPVMLYDVTGRTGIPSSMETYRAAHDLDTVVAVKHSVADAPAAAVLTDLGYAVYTGDESHALGYLAYGAVGLVSVVSHVAGRGLHDMLDAFVAGEHAEALRLHLELKPACDAIMGVPSYGATTAKAALQLVGVLDNRRVRGPLVELDPGEVDALRRGLVAAGLL
jgi:4-hydroxy-tetrahydrodipicolinate synthase